MMRSLVLALGTLSAAGVGFFSLSPLGAGTKATDPVEQRVNANLMRVRINGQWEEFPLMPLADHLCKSPDRLFERYCGDDITTPTN